MMALALILGITVALVALVFALPCEACRKRRQRMEAAYAAWRGRQPTK